MPRFSDDWVIDKSLFEYMNGGQCACCSNMNLFLPDGVEGMIQSISDFETDTADNEISSLNTSPWPPTMRQEVWGDRVKLRLKLKKEIVIYKSFWNEHGDEFSDWISNTVSPKKLQKLLQVPRSEITEKLQTSYNIARHKGFGVVLSACMEQVANFDLTKYNVDARGDDESEVQFEETLKFDRRGGFTMRVCNKDGSRNDETVRVLLKRIESLGGPKLLERAPKKTRDDNDSDEDDKDDDEEDNINAQQTGPSFRSDRRLIRLLIARYWADSLIKKFHADREVGDHDEG
jgi:hypothetical protein